VLEEELIPMAVVKLTKKQKLDELAARLTINLKRKVSLQELLDLCIELASENHDRVAEALREEKETLTTEKVKAIRALAVSFKEDSKGSIDEDVYS
jgi:exopolyphosphatase/pppGpp-phosphohydrolase